MKYLKPINEFFDLNNDFNINADDIKSTLDELFDKWLFLDIEMNKKDENNFTIEIFDKELDEKPNNDLELELKELEEKKVIEQLKSELELKGLDMGSVNYDRDRNRIIINVEKK